MRDIPIEQIVRRMQTENPWWEPPYEINADYKNYKRRAYFSPFFEHLSDEHPRRAVLLMGPRRIGKTVLIHHTIARLIDEGVPPRNICYLSVDHPLYNGCGLEDLVGHYARASGVDVNNERVYVFFDEIQYLKDWERHLKSLVDEARNVTLIASGSAAAALRMKSTESGAGRFSDFLLPPLTFFEYLDLLNLGGIVVESDDPMFEQPNLPQLNQAFLHYLNYGGYPEVALSPAIQADPGRFIKSDIIDKVLLRDLPSLYGIQDIQELNYLFTTLAFNTADELSLEGLSQKAGVAKPTIKRYIEYLEAAFLIKVVHRIDRSARRFQRRHAFKIYLTNPSMRSALFTPASAEDASMGPLTETAIFSQWFHSSAELYFARWPEGEVDIVYLRKGDQKPSWAVEVKWSDRYIDHVNELKPVLTFARTHKLERVSVTTRTRCGVVETQGVRLVFQPASLYCYRVGRNLIEGYSSRARLDAMRTSPGERSI